MNSIEQTAMSNLSQNNVGSIDMADGTVSEPLSEAQARPRGTNEKLEIGFGNVAASKSYKMNNFNLIRLLAALQVLVVHIFNSFSIEAPWLGILKLFPGVPIFFFISGYLISQSYERTRGHGWSDYANRRALRIFPALWLVTIFSAALAIFVGYLAPASVLTIEFWIWFASQVTAAQFYNPDFFRGFGVGVVNGALWTLSVELQFYVLMPVISLFARRIPVLLGLLILASIVTNVVVHSDFAPDGTLNKLIRVSFLPWIFMFVFGALVAYVPRLNAVLLKINAPAVVAAFLIAMIFVGNIETNSSNAINPVAVLFLLILVFKLSQNEHIYNFPGQRIIRKHDISYGIYIFHMPIINALLFMSTLSVFGNSIIAFIGTIAIAILSWVYIEKPALKLKK